MYAIPGVNAWGTLDPVGRRRPEHDRQQLLEAERSRLELCRHGSWRLGIGSGSPYYLAQSSLGVQWIAELASRHPGVAIERFTADPSMAGATLETGVSLADLDAVAWSCCFEPEAAGVLRTLHATGIPTRRVDRRSGRFPLLVLGGPLAEINPLPLVDVIDVLCLGPAEQLLPRLIEAIESCRSNQAVLESLADQDGFLIPALHLGADNRPTRRLRRIRRLGPATSFDEVPASHRVTPFTEYADRALIEISRGCPEHCRYCWIGHAEGRLVAHPAELVRERARELRSLTRRLGLVATAVGDHPQLAEILDACLSLDAEVSVSSLRIPALVPEVLEPLSALGAHTITIAPEAGNDRLRAAAGKTIADDQILEGVIAAQQAGIEGLKLYFMLGLPGETDEDVLSIAALVRRIAAASLPFARSRGRLRDLRVSLGVLVPKPYTPFHREPMLEPTEARRRISLLRRSLAGVRNVRLETPALREAWWQGYLSRAGADAVDLVDELATGASLSTILRTHRERIARVIWTRHQGEVPWHLVSTAPQRSPVSDQDERSSTGKKRDNEKAD